MSYHRFMQTAIDEIVADENSFADVILIGPPAGGYELTMKRKIRMLWQKQVYPTRFQVNWLCFTTVGVTMKKKTIATRHDLQAANQKG